MHISLNNNDIQNKKSVRFKRRNNQKNYNNLGENYKTINNENVINPLIKSQIFNIISIKKR